MLRLLVVDDEIDVCDFMKNFFNERGFEVFVAYNGQEALELVEMKKPQMVILDMRMPVMDGMSVLRELRKADSDTRVIVVTAVEDPSKAEEAKKLGAVEYITKPILLEQLERTVFSLAEQIRMKACAVPGAQASCRQ